MKNNYRHFLQLLFATLLLILPLFITKAFSQSSYYTSMGCSGCHTTVSTCNGCHGHGTHPSSAKSSINVAGATNKSSYAPGETVTVTITGGYKSGWIRAILLDQNGTELARTSGNDSGIGSSGTYPVTLTAPAPATSGSYTWKVGWYGNEYDKAGAAFGANWTPDANNPGHGYEYVSMTPFTVAAAVAAPTISTVSPNSLTQGASNQTVTITGTNLTGGTVSFSNVGVTGGVATISATSITLPVSVTAGAATGAGTVTVTTAGGSISSAFSVTAPVVQAPTITSVSPNSLPQGSSNISVTITGTNLTGGTVSFSNPGVTGGAATVSATSIALPVSVTAGATAGAGTITVTTSGGSIASAFSVTTLQNKLSMTMNGTGSGSVTSSPAGISCLSGSSTGCVASFDATASVTLTQTSSNGSVFAGWTGDCSSFGTGLTCNLDMSAARNVTATFNTGVAQAMIGSTPYSTFASAYTAAAGNDTIRLVDTTIDITSGITIDKDITLDGGYDATLTTKTGNPTVLSGGALTVGTGALTASDIVVM